MMPAAGLPTIPPDVPLGRASYVTELHEIRFFSGSVSDLMAG